MSILKGKEALGRGSWREGGNAKPKEEERGKVTRAD